MTAEVKGLCHVENEGGDGGVPRGHHTFGVLPVSGCILERKHISREYGDMENVLVEGHDSVLAQLSC